MRSYDEYKEILYLWDAGHNKLQIAKLTGIPRPTVRDVISRYVSVGGLEHHFRTGNLSRALAVLELWETGKNQI